MQKQLLKLYILLALICFSNNAMGQANFVWAKQMGGPNSDIGNSIAHDGKGNVYTTGFFQGTVDFDPGAGTFTLAAGPYQNIFISKLDAAGNFLWAKQMGGTGSATGQSIALDVAGNVYVTGDFSGIVDFDPGAGTFTLTPLGGGDIFISKLDETGNFIWAKQMGGTAGDVGYSIAVDVAGNVLTTGYFYYSGDFDPGPGIFNLTWYNGINIFISKLDNAGNFIWAKAMGGLMNDYGQSVATDASGNVYTTGYFEGIADFGGPGNFTLTPGSGTQATFVSKVSAAGNFVWAKAFKGTNSNEAYSIALDGAGNVLTTGHFIGTTDFDPGNGIFNLTSVGFEDVFISKLDGVGNFIWAKRIGGRTYDEASSLAIDALGNIFTTGYFQDTVDFDPGPGTFTLASVGSADIFISKLDASGNFTWVKTMGGIGPDIGQSITLNSAGNVFTTGYFDTIVDFDPGPGTFTLASMGGDIFVHKMCDTPGPPINSTNIANQSLCSGASSTLSIVGLGTVFWYATPSSTAVLGYGTTFITPTLSPGTYTYYAQSFACANSIRTPITLTVSSCVGIEELTLEDVEIKAFPNPNHGSFQIALNAINNDELLIYNCLGQKVHEQSVSNGINEIKTTGLANGLYQIILLSNKQKIKSGKLVVD